ncbi:hypothetical protein M422DRAFT_44663 [Sphaerobolus stellatus SS14]|nr:hypothetical protein M422DRAFT_44663 [Sphaerobolus stellatus SS14]
MNKQHPGHGLPQQQSRGSANNHTSKSGRRGSQAQHQHQLQRSPTSESFESKIVGSAAHTRTPLIIREPSVLESFSRNLRTFLPINLPTSSGAPASRQRRPLSFGATIDEHQQPSHYQHVHPPPALITRDDGERITWAAFDEIDGARVLVLCYPSGFQVWDTSDLGKVRELVNVRTESLGGGGVGTLGPVLRAEVLPNPAGETDEFAAARPLLGVLTPSYLSIFSLSTHTVINHLPFQDATHIIARPTFIVISTSNPPTLHILSPSTFSTLHTLPVPSASSSSFALSLRLLAYASTSPPGHAAPPTASVSTTPASTFSQARDTIGASVIKFSGGVWSGVKAAVAAASGSSSDSAGSPMGDQEDDLYVGGMGGARFSRSAPTGSGLRDVWSREGASAAAAEENISSTAGWVTVLDLNPLLSGTSPRLITSFAPFPSSSSLHLPLQSTSASSPSPVGHIAFTNPPGSLPLLSVAPKDGTKVSLFQIRSGPNLGSAVIDAGNAGLGKSEVPQVKGSGAAVQLPWHWYDLQRGVTSARIESVVGDKVGKWVAVGTGRRTVHIFAPNPYGGKPTRSHLSPKVLNATQLQPLSTPLHPLVRLRPSASSNPSPTSTHPSSQTQTRADSAPAAPITLSFLTPSQSALLPQALLPAPATPGRAQSHLLTPNSSPHNHNHRELGANGLSFQDILVFDPLSGELALRRINLDWNSHHSNSYGLGGSSVGSSVSDHSSGVGAGAEGKAYSMSLPMPIRGMGGIGGGKSRKMSHGNANRERGGEVHGGGHGEEGELVGKEGVVAVWSVRRGREWGEVRGNVSGPSDKGEDKVIGESEKKVSSLHKAELTPHSRLPTILPRPIYLSHQFSFHTFEGEGGGDYHALLRKAQFDIPCVRIEVRKDVEVHPSPSSFGAGGRGAGTGTAGLDPSPFVDEEIDLQGGPQDIMDSEIPFASHTRIRSLSRTSVSRSNSSSAPRPYPFDAPLHSALHTTLDYSGQSPPILPMFPNGPFTTSSSPLPISMLHALPGRTKHVVENVGEGIGRIRREIGRVRSPRVKARARDEYGYEGEGEMVFLPEEEEDLLGGGGGGEESSGGSQTISTPATRAGNTNDNDDVAGDSDALWDAWDDEARATIAEAEMFDEISVKGFLDEERGVRAGKRGAQRALEREEGRALGLQEPAEEELLLDIEPAAEPSGVSVSEPPALLAQSMSQDDHEEPHAHEPIMKAMAASGNLGNAKEGGGRKGGRKRGKGGR